MLALIVFLFPLAYSPGPGNMFFAANGARFGLRATLPANLGYHVATLVMTLIIGFGFLSILTQNQELTFAIQTIGAHYVLWLAWTFLKAGLLDTAQPPRKAQFWDGVILMILNPKAYVIIALMFSQFLNDPISASWMQIIAITMVFTLNNAIAFLVWTAIGDRIAGLFRSKAHARRLNIAFGLMLAGVAVWMNVI